MSKMYAYLTEYSSLQGCNLHAQSPERLTSLYLHALSPKEFQVHDWLCVGTADVTITLYPRADVVTQHVAALRASMEDERLASGVRLLEFDRKINSLLCIEGAAQEVAA